MVESVALAIDTAQANLVELDRRCCDVGRSPRLAALATKLTEIRQVADRPDGPERETARELLEEAGAMVDALQFGCCAPNRLPLYASLLEQLNVLQRHLVPMH